MKFPNANACGGIATFVYKTAADKASGTAFTDDGLFAAEYKLDADFTSVTVTMKFSPSLSVVLICPYVPEGVEIPEHTHKFSDEWSKDETDHWHAATCEHKDEVKDKTAHTWDTGKITKAATCKETGEKTYTCTACGQTKTEGLEKSEHDASYEDCGFCKICGVEQDEIVTFEQNAYNEFVATVDLEVNGSTYLKITPTDDKYGTESWRIEVEAAGGITEGRDYEIRVYDSNGNEVTGDLETGKTYYIVIIGMNNINDVSITVLDHNAM